MAEHAPWREPIKCAHPECESTMKSHAWSVIKTVGWFHQKDGKSFCPDHTPNWVHEWRAKKARYRR